jgi:hypothetical protein
MPMTDGTRTVGVHLDKICEAQQLLVSVDVNKMYLYREFREARIRNVQSNRVLLPCLNYKKNKGKNNV